MGALLPPVLLERLAAILRRGLPAAFCLYLVSEA